MFILINVILAVLIFKIERSKDPKFGKIIHILLLPFIVFSSIGGTIGLVIYLIFSNIKYIFNTLNAKVSDVRSK